MFSVVKLQNKWEMSLSIKIYFRYTVFSFNSRITVYFYTADLNLVFLSQGDPTAYLFSFYI